MKRAHAHSDLSLRVGLTRQRFAFRFTFLSRNKVILVSLATTEIKYFAAFCLFVVIVAG